MLDKIDQHERPYLSVGAWRDLEPVLSWSDQSYSDDVLEFDVPVIEQRQSERFTVLYFACHGSNWAPTQAEAYKAALDIVEAKPYIGKLNKPFLRVGLAHQERQTTPPNYDDIAAAIRKSREMLEWEADWDGEGSPAYLEETWQRATNLLRSSILELWDAQRKLAPTPRVTPGPNGSIDLYWHANNYKLLINIPVDSNEMADYYGQNQYGEIIEGTLDTMTSAMWLLVWLTK